MTRTVYVVGNREAPLALAHFKQAGFEVHQLIASSKAQTIATVKRVIVENGADHIVAIGGDGIVHAVVNAVADLGPHLAGNISIGIIALGSGNDFARALGIPIDDEVAAAKVALLRSTPIDLLNTTHGWVASVATCGFSARVNAQANRMRWPKGQSKYTLATVRLIGTLKSDRITVSLDTVPLPDRQSGSLDDRYSFVSDCSLVAIGNTAYFGGGMKICPEAIPTDGHAELVLVKATGRLELLRYLPTVFSGAHITHPKTTVYQAKAITLEGSTEIVLWGDGEPLGPLPVTIKVIPNAVNVCLPAGTAILQWALSGKGVRSRRRFRTPPRSESTQ